VSRGFAIDPIELQVLSGGLRSICDEMGAVLVRASHSANIKERRDCSTAIFDRGGELVMQAEHIPVHLGSMPAAVEAVAAVAAAGPIEPDDLWILNDPYRGGTHLPDITLVSPLVLAGELSGWVASRAHHADVGGPTPGGMPADSRSLADEGVVIAPRRLDAGGLAELAARMRRPGERLADLRAQRAANLRGLTRIAELADRGGSERLLAGMAAILDYAERRSRNAIGALADGVHEASDELEGAGGAAIPLRVRIEITGERLAVDFGGSAPQVDGNLNCPLSVTRAATLFAIRVLTDPDAPPSAGAFRPVSITAPAGSVLNANPPAAVAAGNVETSSRVADLVLTALAELVDGPAQGQGTMNNLTLAGTSAGGGEITYYETIGGGQGACRTGDGPSAVHVAMSNTLNTPIEALETELPVRVAELAVRRGSGGAGRRRGGDGVIRAIEALEPLRFTLLSDRRVRGPRGRDGGADGRPGHNSINGRPLPGKCEGELQRGDVLRIETPGGGGLGAP